MALRSRRSFLHSLVLAGSVGTAGCTGGGGERGGSAATGTPTGASGADGHSDADTPTEGADTDTPYGTEDEGDTEAPNDTSTPEPTEEAMPWSEYRNTFKRLVQSEAFPSHLPDVTYSDLNDISWVEVGQTDADAPEYERVMDLQLTDDLEPLESYDKETLASEAGLGDTFNNLLGWFSNSAKDTYVQFAAPNRSSTEPQVVRHSYRLHQDENTVAEVTVQPLIWDELRGDNRPHMNAPVSDPVKAFLSDEIDITSP